MHRRPVLHVEALAAMLVFCLGFGCMHSPRAREVVPEPAPFPARQGSGPWLLQVKQVDEWDPPLVHEPGEVFIKARPGSVLRRRTDLWVRTPSGNTGYALTHTGRVVTETRNGLGFNGVAISPDGGRVAYVETTQLTGAQTGPWKLLWVVNSDGTGRRLLVNLDLLFPEGPPRTGPLLWSSDGSRLAYVLYPRQSPGPYRFATVYSVEVATGHQTTVFQVSRAGWLQPLAWSIERGEFTSSLYTPTAQDPGESVHTLAVLRRGASTEQSMPARGFPSPEGQHLLLLSFLDDGRDVFSRLLWNDEVLETPPDFEPFILQHVAWRNAEPVAYVSTYRGYPSNCLTLKNEPPAMLYRVEEGAGSRPRMERLAGHDWQWVLGFSPDDAYVLLAVVTRDPWHGAEGCAPHAFDSILVAERALFEASTSLESLLSSSIRVDDPTSRRGQRLQGFVGWLR